MECEGCGWSVDNCTCSYETGFDAYDSLSDEIESDLMWEWDS